MECYHAYNGRYAVLTPAILLSCRKIRSFGFLDMVLVEVSTASATLVPGHRLHSTSGQKSGTAARLKSSSRFRCGGQHEPQTCRFIEAECRSCRKVGHIQRVCRSQSKSNGAKPVPNSQRNFRRNEARFHYVTVDLNEPPLNYVRVARIEAKPPWVNCQQCRLQVM